MSATPRSGQTLRSFAKKAISQPQSQLANSSPGFTQRTLTAGPEEPSPEITEHIFKLSAISEEPDEDKDDDELLGEIHTLKEQINIPETSTQDTPKDETHRPKDRNNIYKEGYYDLKGKFGSLTYELAPMRVMYDRLISDNEILKEERAILAQENVGLKGENVILKGEVMNSKHENELLRREIQQLRNAHDVQVRHRKLGISDDASPVGDYDVARVGDEARERGVLVGDWEAVEPAIPEIRLTTH